MPKKTEAEQTWEPLIDQAIKFLEQGLIEEARPLLQQADSLSPDNPFIINSFAELALKEADEKTSLDKNGLALKLFKESLAISIREGIPFAQAVKINIFNTCDYLCQLGMGYFKLKHYYRAFHHIELAFSLDPKAVGQDVVLGLLKKHGGAVKANTVAASNIHKFKAADASLKLAKMFYRNDPQLPEIEAIRRNEAAKAIQSTYKRHSSPRI